MWRAHTGMSISHFTADAEVGMRSSAVRPVHCDCEVLPSPALVQEVVPVIAVVLGERTGYRDGTLTVAGDIADDVAVPMVVSLAVDVIAPGARDRRTDTVLDVMPLAAKTEGSVGEGVTRLADGVVLVVTGVDAGGTQLGEAGNSAGVLAERLS